jgi:hypothetical protein
MQNPPSAPDRPRGLSATAWLALACAAVACAAFAAPALRERAPFEALAFAVLVAATAASATRFAGALLPGATLDLRLCAAALIGTCSASASVAWLGTLRVLDLPALAAATACLGALAARLPRERWLAAGALRVADRPARRLVLAALAVFGCGFALFAVNLARYTVKDSDSMWYHLPMVAEWLRSGSIAPSETIPLIARAYPGFRQAVLAFLTAPVGNEHLALLAGFELPFFFVALFAAARRAGASASVAACVACYGTTTPIVLRAAGTTQGTDVLLAILLVCAFLFTREFFARRDARAGLLAGLGLGALAAVKFSGPMYALLVLGILSAEQLLRARGRPAGERAPGVRAWLGLAAGSLAIAAPWYGRNLALYGNPLYPAQVLWFPGPLGREFFAPTTLGRNVLPLIEHWREFLMSHGVLGPAPAGDADRARVRAPAGATHLERGLRAARAAAACFVAFLHQPYNVPYYSPFYNMRYLIAWFAIALVSCVYALRGPWLAPLFLIGAVYTGRAVDRSARGDRRRARARLDRTRARVAPPTRGARRAGAAGPARAGGRRAVRGAARLDRAADGCARALAVLARLRLPRFAQRLRLGELSRFVHAEISGRTVGVHGSDSFFPFYGDRFTNRVERIEGTPATADVLRWIQARGVEFLVCLAPQIDRTGAKEFAFGESLGTRLLRERPGLFALVRESGGSQVLRVRR